MSRHISRDAAIVLAGAALIVAILGFVVALGVFDEPKTVQAQPISQPQMPHTLEGRVDCLLCHGPGGPKPIPASHAGRPATTCLACHPAATATDTRSAPAPAAPSPASQTGDASKTPTQAGANNEACLACHSTQGMTAKIGEDALPLYVDASAFAASVHGKQLACADCHDGKSSVPHEKTNAADARSYAVEASKACQECHQSAYNDYRDSVHGLAVSEGKSSAAVCADCHTAHSVVPSANLSYQADTCNKCHTNVVSSYNDSVHGKLVASGRNDAAACTDCHTRDDSAHKLQGVNAPESVTLGKNVTETCGKCHTEVAESYASTFHGKAMRLGVSGTAPTCVDCHGAYGIQRVHGPEAPLTEAKIAQACAKCHEGANQNFAGGWIGHEEPSPSWFPVVFVTERFLFYLTTIVVAFAVLHVELDLLRWFVNGRKKGKKDQEVNDNGPQH
ncbi:MAG: hypothetical protein HYY30_06400 [Chloroflexi bacterium]|nr:hypothetical protein [Chloroflexota bacterium]